MYRVGSAALLAALAAEPAPLQVIGGSETLVPWPSDVAHVRATAGEVLDWAGRGLRWRAPPVCAPADVELVVQDTSGVEARFPIAVVPGATASRLALLPTEESWELQILSERSVTLLSSQGEVSVSRLEPSCVRATWRLPSSQRPRLAVAAAFESEHLVDWAVLGTPGKATVRIAVTPGTPVVVIVDGRRFHGVAGAQALARVPIEVPPGVRDAEAHGSTAHQRIVLAAPPPSMEHWLTAPDGARWLFVTDARGRPSDEGNTPEGAVRIARGAFRIPPSVAPAKETPPSLATSATAPSTATHEKVSRPVSRPARHDTWSIAVGAGAGPELEPNAAMVARRAWRWRDPFELAGGAAFVGGQSRHVLTEREVTARRLVGTLAGWSELAWHPQGEHFDAALSLGAGLAGSLRRVDVATQAPIEQWLGGPLATAAVQAGWGAIAVQLRAIVSLLPVGVESSSLVGLGGLVWRWDP